MPSPDQCPECDGKGVVGTGDYECSCDWCDGTGEYRNYTTNMEDAFGEDWEVKTK